MLPQSMKRGSPGVGEDNKVNGPKETAEVEETTALSNSVGGQVEKKKWCEWP